MSAAAANPAPGPICVLGMWHLGTVIAACLAEAGFAVVGTDPDPAVVAGLEDGCMPVFEPGLEELVAAGQAAGRLRFETDVAQATGAADVVWVAFDTPVDEDDRADVAFVLDATEAALCAAAPGALVVISAQLPVGSAAALQERCAVARGADDLAFACTPENLRLGRALQAFREPDRIVAGTRRAADRERMAALLEPFCERIEWMGVESAEMTKHALNSFLALSVAFINEISTICEDAGADAAEVARGLKSEHRIGPHAYLGPGDAFAGGTLARDVAFLRERAARAGLEANLLAGLQASNQAHKSWSQRALSKELGGVAGRRVAVWGLTYKPQTNTLRRSGAIALCSWLREQGAVVSAHDPVVTELPLDLAADVQLARDPLEAAAEAEALVICTPWPEYREVAAEGLLGSMTGSLVVDSAGFLKAQLGAAPGIRFVQVGSVSQPDTGRT